MFGAEYPSKGSVQVGGADLGRLPSRKLPKLRRCIGVVFQDFKLLTGANVFENVALALRIRGNNNGLVKKLVPEVLKQVGLDEKAQAATDGLSGGASSKGWP